MKGNDDISILSFVRVVCLRQYALIGYVSPNFIACVVVCYSEY